MAHPDPSLRKRRRIVYLFFLLWGALVLAWTVAVVVDGSFRYGRGGGPVITPEGDPFFFWTVVIASGLLGLTVMVASLLPFLRSFQDEES